MQTDKNTDIKKPSSLLGIRHLQSAMLFLAILCSCCMKINMSLAVVAMTDTEKDNTFYWSSHTKNTILSSFKWGYVITLVPAGELAARFGGMPLVTISVAANSLVTILLPTAAYYGWEYVCACRVIQGLFQGLLFPAVHNLLSKWIPLEESRLGAFIYAGSQLGDAIQMMSSGYIAEFWSWPYIFYVDGALGALWTAIYLLVGSSSPQASKIISVKERKYIQNSLSHVEGKKLKTPWRHVLTSVPVWAIVITQTGVMWGYYTLQTQIPTYMKNILHVNITKNGVLSALPYLSSCTMAFVFGFLFDYILKKRWLTTTATRKFSNSLASFIPAMTLIILANAPAQDALLVTLFCLAVGFHAGFLTGANLATLDIAPNFAGTIAGVTHLVTNLIALNAPFAASALVTDETNPDDWRMLFYISSGLYAASNIFFLVFGTSEKQKWNDPIVDEKNKL